MKSTNNLGNLLRRLRLEKQLPLRKVAAIVDVDVAILSKMERGERKLTKNLVGKLANLYNHDKNELMVLYLTQKIMDTVGEEDLALQALMAAESQIKYARLSDITPVSNKKRIIGEIQKYFQSQNLVAKAWLFGSFARGDDSTASDIDLMIEVPSEVKFTLFDLAEVQEQLQKITSKKVDVIMLNGIQPEMKTRIQNDILLIYEA